MYRLFDVGYEIDLDRALELLALDGGDPGLRRQLIAMRDGECFVRDYRRRVGRIQVDFGPHPDLLRALDTTPGARHAVASG